MNIGSRRNPPVVFSLVALGVVAFAGCGTNHYLIHPREAAPEVIVWSDEFARDQLLVHVEGARPPGPGPFPVIIVHPEEEQTAIAMRGVLYDLAARGYFAMAADYKRWIDGEYRRNMFAWRSAEDILLPIDVTRAYPEADQNRIGVLGFSEGAVLSLLMAAHDPERIKAVVSYSPITDFPRWVAGEGARRGVSPRILFDLARWQLRAESGAPSEDEYEKMLRLASPYYMAENINAPVLLVHGAEDTLVFPEESERLAERLVASGKTTELLLVPKGARLFNFRQEEEATVAWDATLAWLKRYL